MDQIDRNLFEAWNRISAEVRRDRLEALHRSRRRLMAVLTRPSRAWCLCLRASDKRPADQPLFQRKHKFAPHRRKHPPVPCAASVRRREQVLAGLLEGSTYQQIADRLDLTIGTVNAQVSRLYREYDVHSRAELVAHLGRGDAEVRHSPSSHVSAL